MRFWKAATIQLFAGTGRPHISIVVRSVSFMTGLLLLAGLLWRYTPHLHVPGDTVTLCALGWSFSMAGVLLIGALTDAQQQTFLAKLTCFTMMLPLKRTTLSRLYMYASAPINLAEVVLVTTVLGAAVLHDLPWYYALAALVPACLLAAFTDNLLRIARVSASWQPYVWRYGLVTCAGWLGYSLLTVPLDSQIIYEAAIGGMSFAVLILSITLAARPLRTTFEAFHIPVIEGRPGVCEALPLRAFRTSRYIGANLVLAVAVVGLAVLCRAPNPQMPIDAAVLVLMMLIGTLGQEVRALSPARYPIELTLYGAFHRWLCAQWLLSAINGLIWIDITLWVVWLWAPQSLTVSITEAGIIGLGFIAAGMAAAAIAVPQKQDILVQCASTGIYALLLWGFMKLLSVTTGHAPLALTGLWAIGVAFALVWAIEYVRWQRTIRRWHVAK